MHEIAGRPIGEAVRSYDDLLAALRARALELGATRKQLAEVAGLADGYVATLLAPRPIRSLGRTSMGPVLTALGLKLVIVEDAEALERYADRVGGGKRSYQLNGAKNAPVILQISRRKLRKMGLASVSARMRKIPARKRQAIARKAGKARMRAMSPEMRREFARKAARARWRKAKCNTT